MTDRIVQFRTTAERDLSQILRFIRKDNRKAARRFARAVEKVVDLLLEFPYLGTPYDETDPDFSEIRFAIVPGFKNYVLLYRPLENGIDVIRIFHGAREISAPN